MKNQVEVIKEETPLLPLTSTYECMGKLIPLMYMDTKRIQIEKWVLSWALILALGREMQENLKF